MQHDKIYQLFSNRYNQSTWKEFLGLSFANTRLLTTPQSLTVDNAIALSVQNLGNIILDEDGIERQIAVFDVTLAKGIILEKNRVGLRNLLRKYWRDIDAAFIVYHLEGMPNWRFTFVSELTGYNDEGEFIKITTEPKRFTYILGEGESTRTAVERFAHLFKKTTQISLNDIKEAFSVEKLSKSFFDAYKKHYDTLCTHLSSEITIRNGIFKEDDKAIRDFSKKFLGRIVFLYFIQKKGWLGVPPKEKYGKGDTKFLQNQFDNFRNKDLFYKEFLTILFFETLNKYRNDDIFNYDNQKFLTPHSQVKIPFLSGGLFDEDDLKQRDITIPSNVMRNIFEFFNQYNFTIYEDSPDDHTVAVDPEMLGHIFENLLEDNKDKGAFYTPREIVHYMCQESIIEYLCTTLSVGEDASKRKAIEELFKLKEVNPILQLELKKLNKALDSLKICDPAIGSGAFPMGLLHEIFTAKQTLHLHEHGNTLSFDASAVKQNIIQNSIYGVDIEKGAVDIARLRFWLSLVVDEDEPRALPNLDYKIVHGNSLVSKFDDEIVDIDWNPKGSVGKADEYLNNLKIALDTLSNKQKEYFSAALKADLKAEIRNLKLDILINQLSFNLALYQNRNQIKFDSGLGLKPAEVKSNAIISEQLDKYELLIKKCQHLKEHPDLPFNFFDWKLDFPEVMNEQVVENVGFDIVIGNPPYVGHKGGMKDLFRELKNTSLGEKFNNERMDIFYYFFHLSINIANDNGIIGFITTNYYLTADSAVKLRKDIKERSRIIKLINFNELKVFESALGQHNIMTFLTKNSKRYSCSILNINKKGFANSEQIVRILENKDNDMLYYNQNNQEVFDGDKYYIRLQNFTKSTEANSSIILAKIKASKELLGRYFNISQGIVTGIDKVSPKHITRHKEFTESKGNGIYVISQEEKTNIGSSKLIKPWYKNSDIKRYQINEIPTKWLIHTSVEINLKEYSNIEKHLNFYKDLITERNFESGELSKAKRQNRWWALSSSRWEFNFDAPKIVSPQRSNLNTFAYTEKSWYASADVYFITERETEFSLKYLLGILNSRLIYYWLYHRGKRKGEMLELYLTPLSEIPIKKPNINEQILIEQLVNNVIASKKNYPLFETKFIENQIDNLVYRLYELTYDEVRVIDPHFSLTAEEYNAISLE